MISSIATPLFRVLFEYTQSCYFLCMHTKHETLLMHDLLILLIIYVSPVRFGSQAVYFSDILSFLICDSCQVKHASLVTLFSNLDTLYRCFLPSYMLCTAVNCTWRYFNPLLHVFSVCRCMGRRRSGLYPFFLALHIKHHDEHHTSTDFCPNHHLIA